MAFLNVQDAYDSKFGSVATAGQAQVPTCSLRRAGETEGSDAEDAEIWSHAPLLYRPKKPDKSGSCQVLTAWVGGHEVILASRDMRAFEFAPALSEGDACIAVPGGRGTVIIKQSGAVSLFRSGENVDSYISIESDGTVLMGNEWGAVSLGRDGFVVHLSDGSHFQLGPTGCLLQTSVFAAKAACMLGMQPTGPVALATLTPSPMVFA